MAEYRDQPSVSHQTLYKNNVFSIDNLQQKHREETVELRKKKRDDGFIRARRLLELNRSAIQDDECQCGTESRSIFDNDLIADLISGVEKRELRALKIYSRLFTDVRCIDDAFDLQIIPAFFEIFMRSTPFSDLELLCVIVISKLSNDFNRISLFFEDGVVAKLINLLSSSNEALDHVMFLLEEVVHISPYARSVCTELKLLPLAIDVYSRHDRLNLRRQILSMINNYFDFEIPLEDIEEVLFSFCQYVIMNEADEILLTEVILTLEKIAKYSPKHADKIISSEILSVAMEFLTNDVDQACLMLVKTVVSYGESYVKILTQLGYFEKIWGIATSISQTTEKRSEAFAAISVFINKGYLHLNPEFTSTLAVGLIENVTESKFEVRQNSLLAIKQLLLHGDNAAILTQDSTMKLIIALCDLLTVMHVDTVLVAIWCLDKIMDYAIMNGRDVELILMLDAQNAREKFEFLTNSQSYEVFKAADSFVSKYFDNHQEDDDDLDLR